MTAPSQINSGLHMLGSSSQGLASDTRSVDALRSIASKDPQAAIKETAKQFEALFMKELMKSMRETSLNSGWLDNSGTQMGSEMLDTQYANMMTGMPGGLSEAIAKQLQRQLGGEQDGSVAHGLLPLAGNPPALRPLRGVTPEIRPLKSGFEQSVSPSIGAIEEANVPPPPRLSGDQISAKSSTPKELRQAEFVQRHALAAKAASVQTGIPADFMVAQAAHESGWGQREIKMPDGSTSFNVFGIKAGPRWGGKVAEVTTTEYVNGQAHKVTAKFRAYDSYEAAFKDYANMLKSSPRYSGVVANAQSADGFAQGLQKAGYATDPAYADKLTRVIQTTLRLQRMVS
jgi:flagellar protein FlgJ